MVSKALVTGARGHTGSFLVNLLVNNGWKVVATDLDRTERKKVMTKENVFGHDIHYLNIDNPNVKFIAADLTDSDSLKKLFEEEKDYSAIFNPASLYDYFAELDLLRKINVGGLNNLLSVMEEIYGTDKNMPRLLHWSTCGVYGEPDYKKNSKGFPIPADETAPYDPPNNYSVSKMEQELALKEFASRTGLKYTIIRPAPIYGPYQAYGAFHIFYLFHKLGHMTLPLVFPKQKKLMMPMVHVEDLVKAALFLWDKEEAINEAFNVTGDNATQEDWMEFTFQELGIQYTHLPIWFPIYKTVAKMLFAIAKREEGKAKKWGIRPKFDVPMAGYITHQYFFSNEKIKSLGFKFKYANPFEGTRQTIRWYVDAGWFEREEFSIDTDRKPDEKTENELEQSKIKTEGIA